MTQLLIDRATLEQMVRMLESDQLRAQLADAELHTKQVERGLDKATAQLAEIEKTEPVAYMVQFSPGSRWIELTKEEFDSDLDGHIVYKKQAFFTHPMPAQDVSAEFVRVIQFAIAQGISAREFLDSWLHGDTDEWPEFTNAKGAK